ncbi:MAG: M48 family metalloprotease [Symploca sp. SIO2B6]|nr:M48 family metalloprotease [Symploca sp. SIO2B6]
MASVQDPSLNKGLAALKQGNYSVAIAHLEGIRETELDESAVSKASQALVVAYHKSGNIQNAIALCQHLTQDPDTEVKKWATKTLAKFSTQERLKAEIANNNLQAAKPSNSKTSPNLKQQLLNSTKSLFSNSKTQNPKPKTQNPSLLPVASSQVSTSAELYTPRPRWRNRGRAQRRRTLKPPKLRRLWLAQIVTAIALFLLLRFLVQLTMSIANTILIKLPYFEPLQLFYRDPTTAISILIAILLILSPWLIDRLLKSSHSLEKLSLTELASHSPEAAQLIQSFCRQKHLPLPKLGILPTEAPVALTYGNLPRTARIVVSEGLLEQLHDDEIATIYANQLGHIFYWDLILISLGTLILQIPYTIYWQVAQWGESLSEHLTSKFSSFRQFGKPILLGITSVVSALSYGIYWLMRLPLLWFSRVRLYYSDRLAIEITGNPNGLTRALLKIGLGISQDIQTFGNTSKLLESYDLLLPVGYQQAITLGSFSPQTPFETILKWDCINLYRDWLIISASHPLIGERLHLPTRYAHFLKIEPELELPPLTPPIRNNTALLSKIKNSYKALPLLQSSVLFGLMLGIVLRGFLWTIGKISDWLNIGNLIWMHNAAPFLNACVLIAFSICVFIWINSYFPDIEANNIWAQPNLGAFFSNPDTLSPDSQPLELTGTLLGRRGLLNWLGQDLILQTSTGLVKLHFFSILGPFGNLLPQPIRANDLIEKQVTVTGWFRRGATPWIDVETIGTENGKIVKANYPIWITILAVAAALWGAYQIWQLPA